MLRGTIEWFNIVYVFFVIARCLVYMFVLYCCHHCCHGIILHLFSSAACNCHREKLPLSTRSIDSFSFFHSFPGKLSHRTLLIDCHHFCMIKQSINRSLDFEIKLSTFCCFGVRPIVLCTLKVQSTKSTNFIRIICTLNLLIYI